MKLTCERQKLNEAVLNVQRAVSTKSTVPALEGILLKAEDDSLQLCGYDLELGMTTAVPAQISEEGSVVLSARLLGDIVRRLAAEQVELTADAKQMTTISCGSAEFSIVGIPAQEYPELPAINGEANLKIPGGVLKSMIRQTLFAVAENDAKPIHTGTLFELGDDCIRLVSVDGYRLAIREEKIPGAEKNSFVVPGKTLGEILKLPADDDQEIELQVGRRHILFGIGNYTVISRLLEGEFLDYHAALPNASSTEIRVSVRDFIDSVERVSLLITDRLKSPVRCVFQENEIRVSCATAIGHASDQLSAKIEGEAVEMGFNNRFLLDALRNSDCDEVKILLNGALSPMKILPPQGEEFTFLVLPVRLKTSAD